MLQDKPENSEEAEEQFTDRYQGSNSAKTPVHQDQASKGAAQQDGFFITEDLNQQDREQPVEMMPQNEVGDYDDDKGATTDEKDRSTSN